MLIMTADQKEHSQDAFLQKNKKALFPLVKFQLKKSYQARELILTSFLTASSIVP